MTTVEKVKTATTKAETRVSSIDERSREKVVRESREHYRSFLESINRSTDRDIDRALRRA